PARGRVRGGAGRGYGQGLECLRPGRESVWLLFAGHGVGDRSARARKLLRLRGGSCPGGCPRRAGGPSTGGQRQRRRGQRAGLRAQGEWRQSRTMMPTVSPRKRLLFVCIENSNRSQMAEAFARLHGGDGVEAYSAGSRPSGRVNPRAIEFMREVG